MFSCTPQCYFHLFRNGIRRLMNENATFFISVWLESLSDLERVFSAYTLHLSVHCSLSLLHYNQFKYVTITKFQTPNSLNPQSQIHSIWLRTMQLNSDRVGMHSNGLVKLIQIIHLYICTFVVCINNLYNTHSISYSVFKKKRRNNQKQHRIMLRCMKHICFNVFHFKCSGKEDNRPNTNVVHAHELLFAVFFLGHICIDIEAYRQNVSVFRMPLSLEKSIAVDCVHFIFYMFDVRAVQ